MNNRNKYLRRQLIVGGILFSLGLACGVNINVLAKENVAEVKTAEPIKIPKIDLEPKIESLGLFTLTAYCPCSKCCGKSDGITASGTTAIAGRTIAADTSIYPFGTELIINGQAYIVEDRGGAIKGNKIDIFFNDHEEALNFGMKRDVEVFKKVN